MGALPRPDVQAGPWRELVDALHELHHRAGWPSLRTLAREVGCSHTTVSTVFSAPKLPPWGVLELLVEAMGGDPRQFRSLWVAAGAPSTERAGPRTTTSRMAGRRHELATVRRHLESGAGLLLVTGEAGIGKTRLVSGAAESVDPFVATGSCLPLATDVPLLPVADALRQVYELDDGQWVKEALGDCPPYVSASLARLLPELALDGAPPASDSGDLLYLFSAIAALLTRLAEYRPLAILVEDLHWADSATLDLVEQLVVRPRAPRLLGTWRLDDPSTPHDKNEWFARIRRSGVAVVELRQLTVEETADQLRLLTGTEPDAALVARIHSRSAGQPLFTEHLAAQAGEGDLPGLLTDLLDQRLGLLDGPPWQVARALGFADRGLRDDALRHSTGLSHDDLVAALHELRDRRLLSLGASESEVRLSHPLLAEAVRRRVMPGEAADEHRRLATALAAGPDSTAGEIAAHWAAAEDAPAELSWRVRAAREASQRLGPVQEAEHWLRALELWPEGDTVHGTPPLNRTRAAFHAMDALLNAGQIERADVLAASLMPTLEELPPRDAAELLAIAASCEGDLRSLEEALRLCERSVAIFETLGPSIDLILSLRGQAALLVELGRLDDGAAVQDRAWRVNQVVGDAQQERQIMAERAWHLFENGRRAEALDAVAAAMLIRTAVPDPFGDITLAKHQADLLLLSGASAADVVAAARPGLVIAEQGAIASTDVAWLNHDIGLALARSGELRGAAELLDPLTASELGMAHHPLDLARTDLDLRRGRFDDVRARIGTSAPRPRDLDGRAQPLVRAACRARAVGGSARPGPRAHDDLARGAGDDRGGRLRRAVLRPHRPGFR